MATLESKNFTQRIIYQELNQPFAIDDFSTLNEKFAVGNIQPPNGGGYPSLKYFCLGRGGHTAVIGANQTVLISYKRKLCTFSSLFEHLPFVMVPTTIGGVFNDLSINDRLKYRMRKKITVTDSLGISTDYYAYYLKVLEPSNFVLTNTVVQLVNGEITSTTDYIPTVDDLNPVPVNDSDTVITIMDGKHFLVRGSFSIVLSPSDITNLVDACTILYGDASYATLSEIGIVSGFDETYLSPYYDNVTYTEARTAQIQVFSDVFEILQANSDPVSLKFGLKKVLPHPAL